MIKSISLTNYLGNTLSMVLSEPEKSGFVITEIDGLGPVKADIHTTDIATSDGSIFNSARLTDRNIVLKVRFLAKNSIEDTRQLSYKYFPIKTKVTFGIITDNREALIEGYVESNEPDIFSDEESAQISIVCPNPYFYSAEINNTLFSGVEAAFEFPFENDSLTEKVIELGTIENKTERSVWYDGDAEVGVTMSIHALGSASNVTIYNVMTRESMSIDTDKLAALTGYGIIASDDIIISTVKGYKSIKLLRGGTETNILNCLDKDADWFQLSKGDNIFTYIAESGGSNLQFKIANQILYEGI